MANDRIKVAGYSKKTFLDGGTEYRNFSPDIVGVQLTNGGNATSLFTLGNFSITTNTEPKVSKNFKTNSFSNFVSLADLDLTVQSALNLLYDNAGVILNLDKRDLTNYALFGSFREFTRVSLENIITNWPAALYADPTFAIAPDYTTQTGNTIENYVYNVLTREATFKVNVNTLSNQYDINFLINGNLSDTYNETNALRNLTIKYASYCIRYNNQEYEILGFTGSTRLSNDYIYFKVKGDPFSGLTNAPLIYYIKPNKTEEDKFFNALPNFEYYLLNRLIIPQYTATFDFKIKTDDGSIINTTDSVTWPTSDGYNLDFNTDAYEDYATKLLNISDNLDLTTSNLMVRFLVTESITDFDTTATHVGPLDQDTSDQKVNKTLTIYGREYDDINQFITGIQFANTVSYNKLNNTPDIYLKNIARVLGWDLISSVLENNLLKSYITPQASTYAGQTVGLTAVEADIELWRRLILNSPWLWKSKGTRKGIEFMFKFIGTPLGLIQFNEYIYLAENKLDIEIFEEVLRQNSLSTDIGLYPISISGYPQPFTNTSNLYYQSNGLWYRETGGPDSVVDITTGNNPHVGPYDGGYKYINQFRTLIPNFIPATITSETVTTTTSNIFSNYNIGKFTGYSGQTYVNLSSDDGVDFSDCYVVDATVILDPKNRKDETNCGCELPENLRALSVCIDKQKSIEVNECDFVDYAFNTDQTYYLYYYPQYDINGNVTGNLRESIFTNPICCTKGTPVYYNDVHDDGVTFTPQNSGYICCTSNAGSQAGGDCGCFVTCNWRVNESIRTTVISGNTYLVFVDELGQNRTSSYNGCNCLKNYTQKIQVTDPYIGEIGFACQLNTTGKSDITSYNSIIIDTYKERAKGTIGCNETIVRQTTPLTPKTFLVVVNDGSDVGKRVNNIFYNTVGNTTRGGDFSNYSVALSASSQSGPQIGYFYGYTPAPQLAVQYGDTIGVNVYSGTTSYVNVNLAFNPSIHKIGYLVSNTEFTSANFAQQLPNVIDISNTIQPIGVSRASGYYRATYPLIYAGNPTNVYMVVNYTNPNTNTNTGTNTNTNTNTGTNTGTNTNTNTNTGTNTNTNTNTSTNTNTNDERFCTKFENTNGTARTIYWRDINGRLRSESLAGNSTVNKCAVSNSSSGDNVIIRQSTTPCTSDTDCELTLTTNTPQADFIVINNATANIINDVKINGQSLPGNRAGIYPVPANGGTISAVRILPTFTGRISVYIDAFLFGTTTPNISSILTLYIGTTQLEQIIVNTQTAPDQTNVMAQFSQFRFTVGDVIRIIHESSAD